MILKPGLRPLSGNRTPDVNQACCPLHGRANEIDTMKAVELGVIENLTVGGIEQPVHARMKQDQLNLDDRHEQPGDGVAVTAADKCARQMAVRFQSITASAIAPRGSASR